MSDESQGNGEAEPGVAPELDFAAFSAPAVLSDGVVINEKDGTFRLSFTEYSSTHGVLLRCAVALSTKGADDLAKLLTSMVANAKGRQP